MKTTIRILISLLFVFLVSSCSAPALSVNPITSPEDADPDERLVGVWQGVDKEDGMVALLVIGPPKKNISRLLYFGVTDEGIGLYNLVTFTSTLESGGYMNIFYPEELKDYDYEESGYFLEEDKLTKEYFRDYYFFMKYEYLKPDVLVMRLFENSPIREAIDEGRLKELDVDSGLIINDTSENIAAFIESAPPGELLSDQDRLVFKRLAPMADESILEEIKAMIKSQEKKEKAREPGVKEELSPPEKEEVEKIDAEGDDKKEEGKE